MTNRCLLFKLSNIIKLNESNLNNLNKNLLTLLSWSFECMGCTLNS